MQLEVTSAGYLSSFDWLIVHVVLYSVTRLSAGKHLFIAPFIIFSILCDTVSPLYDRQMNTFFFSTVGHFSFSSPSLLYFRIIPFGYSFSLRHFSTKLNLSFTLLGEHNFLALP
uniref:Uncharacterized protein n=1 Tax=Trichobilharzia regenti TaxID=157069 RepID=A0AA85JYZ5_TRIRE|nr:unnamed protein product [Trichobilharzia regenti]